jgi:hypothetical protein
MPYNDDDEFDSNPAHPGIMSRPDQWLNPMQLINPLNPLNPNNIDSHVEVPKVETQKELEARHKKLSDAADKANSDYTNAMNQAHAMVASGTNYSHDKLHDLAMQAADAQRAQAHIRAMKAQLPATDAMKRAARSAALDANATNRAPVNVEMPATEALDRLAKQRATQQ